jgi:hypothetical protein
MEGFANGGIAWRDCLSPKFILFSIYCVHGNKNEREALTNQLLRCIIVMNVHNGAKYMEVL